MAARIAGEIHARKEKQQEIRDLKKYFNRSVPQLRSKFAGNLLYGRIQGKGVVKEQAESLNLTIEKYIVCVGRKVVGENKIHTGDKWIEEFACINIFEEIFNDFGIHVLSAEMFLQKNHLLRLHFPYSLLLMHLHSPLISKFCLHILYYFYKQK